MKKITFFTCGTVISFLLVIITTCPLRAQNTQTAGQNGFTLILKGAPMELALQNLVQTTGMDLIYDPAIIPNHTVFKTAKNKTAEAILRLILDKSGLDFYRLSSGTYVLTALPRQQILPGNLQGQVFDWQTGEPLPGANIIITKVHGGTSTGQSGFFSIPRLQPGPHEIIVTYVGYKSVRDTVYIPAGKTTSNNFGMVSEPVLVEPLVVEGIQKRLPAPRAFSERLNASGLAEKSALGGIDPIKGLDAVSGIDFNIPLADYNIQGGNAGEHQLRLDGVPVYNPVSMGRLLGAFSPYAIKNVRIKKAGFEAPAGSRLAGIIDVKHQLDKTEKPNFLLQLNPLNANARVNNTFNIKNGPEINVMAAARGDIWRWYKQPQIQQTLKNWDQLDPVLTNHFFQSDTSETFFQQRDNSYDITYYDLHAAARVKHNAFHQTYISAYRGTNRLQTDLLSENTFAEAALNSFPPGLYFSIDRYNWTNTLGKLEHQWLINSRFDASLGGYITHHSLDHDYSITDNFDPGIFNNSINIFQNTEQQTINSLNTGDENAILESSAELKLRYSASKNYDIEGGIGGTFLDYRFNLSNVFFSSVQAENRSFLVSGYIQNEFLLSPKTRLAAGSRITFVPSRDLVFAEPRLSIQHDEPQTSIGYVSLQLSGGIYRQFINQFDVTNVGPSSIVPSIRFRAPADYTTTVPKAYHVAGNVLWEPAENWEVRWESYYKWIPSRLALDYSNLSQFSAFITEGSLSSQQQFITQAKGYAYGTAFSFRKKMQPLNIALQGKYQLNIARQRIPSRFNGTYQPLSSGQPHKVNISTDWAASPRLTFLLNWQRIWGRSWGFRRAYYDYLSIREDRSFGAFSFDDPGSDKLPPYSQLDAGVSYKQPVANSFIHFRLDIYNLLNHENVLNWWLSPSRAADETLTFERRERTLTGFWPSLSVKFSY